MTWLIKNLQTWTPFSAVILLVTLGVTFIIVWDTINGIVLPAYVVALISLLVGGTGATQLVTHGTILANGTAAATAATAASAAAQAVIIHTSEMNKGVGTGEVHS